MTSLIQTLGIASCLGGPNRPCGYAAELLRDEFAQHGGAETSPRLQWHMVYPETHGSKQSRVYRLNKRVGEFTRYWTETRHRFLVVGGDHSCALGTWPGVMEGLAQYDEFGLLWLDAHMDAHTFLTTPSGNIHGMPVAALLGRADEKLAAMYPTSRFVKPENLILIGARSYEPEEYALLQRAGIKIVFGRDIGDFAQTVQAAMDQLDKTCQAIGVSLDLDLIDPEDAPGVETQVPGGVEATALLAALALISSHSKVCGLEISEFNPDSDQNGRTLKLMRTLIETFYGASSPNKSLGSSRSGSKASSRPI